MPEIDIIKDLAKQVLLIPNAEGRLINFLWDRAERLVRNVEIISRLPELSNSGIPIDHFCLTTATYFSETGSSCYFTTRTNGKKTTSSNGNGHDSDLDNTISIVTEKLSGTVKPARIEKICKIITESTNHSTRMIEGMVLSDARNLDDMGATGIFNEIRRFAFSGKGVCDVVQNWQNKLDYQYWQARLKEGFRFEQVRKLAEQRLSNTESFMNLLKMEAEGQDIEEFLLTSI